MRLRDKRLRFSIKTFTMRIILTTDAKSGHVRIELSEEQPTMLAPAKEDFPVSQKALCAN